MKKILVPTDFSKHAGYALRVAAQIANKTGSEIFLLHMLELPNQMSDAIDKGSTVPEVLFFMEKAHEKFDKIKDKKILRGLQVTEVVQFQKTFEGIIEFSKKQEVDLIVMGSHGSNGFEEIFIGSNTEKVIRKSNVPVLVIKENLDEFLVKNFVFASDFSKEAKKSFEKAIKFAEVFDAYLNLLMINTPNQFKSTSDAEEIMNNFVKDFNLPLDSYSLHLYNEINIEKGILKFSNNIKADLIGMSTHGRMGLNHFFNGSISEDLVNHTTKSVITFKI